MRDDIISVVSEDRNLILILSVLYVRGHFFVYFVSHLLTCLLTLTFAYKYATMLILGGTAIHECMAHWHVRVTQL